MAITEGGGCCPVRGQGPILGVARPSDGCGMVISLVSDGCGK